MTPTDTRTEAEKALKDLERCEGFAGRKGVPTPHMLPYDFLFGTDNGKTFKGHIETIRQALTAQEPVDVDDLRLGDPKYGSPTGDWKYVDGWNDCLASLNSRNLLRSEPQWQDISTAPRDVRVMTYRKVDKIENVIWDNREEFSTLHTGYNTWTSWPSGYMQPTHWMYLPQPPAPEGE